MTSDMIIMFLVGGVIFIAYVFGLMKAIMWGHKSQEEERLNDPELRNYYARHNMPDSMDYDGHGNYGRFPSNPYDKRKKRKKGSQSRMKSYFWHKDQN